MYIYIYTHTYIHTYNMFKRGRVLLTKILLPRAAPCVVPDGY